jgi:uncharacterized protein (TIGR03118 family)
MTKRLSTSWKIYALAGLTSVCAILFLALTAGAAGYVQNNLVSDIPGADNTDVHLVNPWGIASSPTSPFWVSDNKTGVATLYNTSGTTQALIVTIPPSLGGTSPSAPTGIVFNGTAVFEVQPGSPARFIFATEDGTISGWNPDVNSAAAILKVDNSAAGAVYTGLAIGPSFLYASNFSQGIIDVFNSNFGPTTLVGSFTDPNLPSGYAPFNVQNIGGNLFVTYALQDATKHSDVAGPGNGFVDVFDTNGNFLRRLISEAQLNSPWGVALAPGQFGQFSNALLVANFGDGKINAFDPSTGDFLGTLTDGSGKPIVIDSLRGLIFGNGGTGGDPNTLYFSAGLGGGQHGLFGSLAPVPVPSTLMLLGSGLLGLVGLRYRARKS